MSLSVPVAAREAVRRGRKRRTRRGRGAIFGLAIALVAIFMVTLCVGRTTYPLEDVARVLLGEQVPGASFTVGELRLPRAVLGALAGAAFGLAGVTFQTMLRNVLASPDVIGIASGASAAAVFAIVVLHLPNSTVALLAVVGGLLTALLIYVLAYRGGVAGMRLILVGIGMAAMLDSVVAYQLTGAAAWDLQTASRWLTGSLNGAAWKHVGPLACAFVVLAPMLLVLSRGLSVMRLGDDSAAALGVRVEITRALVIVIAVGLSAFATAATGPIAFVAFVAGPIAARVGGASGLMVSSALVGALLVLTSDLVGQFLVGTRYPVGVITGAIGAPYLLLLLIRINRAGEAL